MDEGQASPEFGGLDALLDELFPFHLIIDLGEEPRVAGVGQSLRRWTGREMTGKRFADCFSILRPAVSVLESTDLVKKKESVFVLQAQGHFAQLRGQLIVLQGARALFIGSPVLTTTSRVEELGLSIADFAPHDATVDLIVLQRFAEMQLADLKDQAAELSATQQARDQLSQSASTDPLTGLANRRAFWQRCTSWSKSVSWPCFS